MNTILKLLSVSFLFIYASCSSNEDNSPKTLPEAKPIVLKTEFNEKLNSSKDLAFDLFHTTYKYNKTNNIFISPLSVDMALGMTWNGADGDTKTEMQAALHNLGYTPEQINEYAKTLREALINVDPSTQLGIVNSIWYRSGFNVEKEFIKVNQDNYNAEIRDLDFSSPDDALTQINNWCKKNTNNKIDKIVDQISPNTAMFLINAIYFKGIWRSQFDKKNTAVSDFHAENGTKQSVNMMMQQFSYAYTEDSYGRYLEVPYGNNAFSMMLMLPNENKSIDDLIQNFNPENWGYITNKLKIHKVNLHLPRFKVECEYNLEEKILPDMGMQLAFMPELANFSKINKDIPLHISKVKHKTFVEVNEEGTEAAAVTSVSMELTSAGPGHQDIINYIVDKPFVFAIKEKSTRLIMFIGKIGTITE